MPTTPLFISIVVIAVVIKPEEIKEIGNLGDLLPSSKDGSYLLQSAEKTWYLCSYKEPIKEEEEFVKTAASL